MRTIDTHTHVLTEETIALLNKETPKAAIKLTPIDNNFVTLEVAGVPYKPFPRGGFDIRAAARRHGCQRRRRACAFRHAANLSLWPRHAGRHEFRTTRLPS